MLTWATTINPNVKSPRHRHICSITNFHAAYRGMFWIKARWNSTDLNDEGCARTRLYSLPCDEREPKQRSQFRKNCGRRWIQWQLLPMPTRSRLPWKRKRKERKEKFRAHLPYPMISQTVRSWLSRVALGTNKPLWLKLTLSNVKQNLHLRNRATDLDISSNLVLHLEHVTFSASKRMWSNVAAPKLQPKPLSYGRKSSETKIVHLSVYLVWTTHFLNREQKF